MLKNDYKYNLTNFMGQCELNYGLLCRLLPDIENEDEFDYFVKNRFRMNLQVTERCRYTTCIHFTVNNDEQSNWLPEIEIDIRLYHDAHLAEVVDNRGVAMLPINPYPNPDMLHKDEKQGLNEFLSEWLFFCLKHGQSTESIQADWLARKEE